MVPFQQSTLESRHSTALARELLSPAVRDLEQYMFSASAICRKALSAIDLSGRTVVELGVGTGMLTQLILERNPQRVVGYDLDPQVTPEGVKSRIDLRIGDLAAQSYDCFADPAHCLICNPRGVISAL